MNDLAIRVDHLAKQYRIGAKQEPYGTLREAVVRMASAPWRWIRGGDGTRSPTIWALKDVSFEVRRGEVVGVIGRNGAGKSTLLKILSRITDPTEGEADIDGRLGSLLEVGTGFHPELTGRENIYLNGAVLGMTRSEIRKNFDGIVAFAEVEPFIDTPVKHYSSGMYLRLAFAVAAHLEPEILLVDEVLAVGDLAFQSKCLGKMKDISRSGRTVLFVSHNMSAVQRLCSRAILLDQGRVVQDGPADEVIGTYVKSVHGSWGEASPDRLETAPGSEEIRLAGVRVIEEASGEAVTSVSIERPLSVRIRYRVGSVPIRFRCALSLYTQGTCAFTTVEPVETERTEAGYYESSVSIPGNLLTEGEYAVHVSIFSSRGVKMRHVSEPGAAVFHIYDPMTGRSARGDYAEGWSGVVRPQLAWGCRYLGTKADL